MAGYFESNYNVFSAIFHLWFLFSRLCSQLFVDLFIGFFCQVTAQVLIHIQGVNMKVYRFENPCFVLGLTCAVVHLSMPVMVDLLDCVCPGYQSLQALVPTPNLPLPALSRFLRCCRPKRQGGGQSRRQWRRPRGRRGVGAEAGMRTRGRSSPVGRGRAGAGGALAKEKREEECRKRSVRKSINLSLFEPAIWQRPIRCLC